MCFFFPAIFPSGKVKSFTSSKGTGLRACRGRPPDDTVTPKNDLTPEQVRETPPRKQAGWAGGSPSAPGVPFPQILWPICSSSLRVKCNCCCAWYPLVFIYLLINLDQRMLNETMFFQQVLSIANLHTLFYPSNVNPADSETKLEKGSGLQIMVHYQEFSGLT